MREQRTSLKNEDPVLRGLRLALDGLYGNRIQRVILFGSRARGDNTPESDYDLALFLADLPDRWAELDRLLPMRLEFIAKNDTGLTVLPFAAGDYDSRTGLMHAIRTEGIPL